MHWNLSSCTPVSLVPFSSSLAPKPCLTRKLDVMIRVPQRNMESVFPRAIGLETNAVESLPPWTLDQIVGLAFGSLLVVFYFSAGVVDNYVAKIQRSKLGLCEECGGLYEAQTCQKRACPFK